MKQVFQSLRTGETQVVDVPIPALRPGMALVQTAASLISAGTERMIVEFAERSLLGKARSRPDLARQVLEKARRDGILTALEAAVNRLDQPIPLGYSSAGTVVALGEGFTGAHLGERVACAGGGYAVHAEYALIPQNLLARVPEQVSAEEAAFATLGAIALHGFRLAETSLGERVAVIGLGLLGLLAVQIATAAGCAVLGIDLDHSRVQLAQTLGVEARLRAEAEESALSFSHGRGCDAILICADTPTADPVRLAGAIARDRARVIAIGSVGQQLPRKLYYEKELTFINSRSYGPGRYDPAYEEGGQDYPPGYVRWTEGRNLQAVIDLIASGRLNVKALITHRFPIEDAPRAYRLITSKPAQPYLGVILIYPQSPSVEISSEQRRIVLKPSLQIAGVGSPDGAPAISANLRLGVLGAGNFASTVMLPILKKLAAFQLIGVVSASGASARRAADQFGFAYASSDEGQLLQDPDINVVAIFTRHHLHAHQVLAALQAGKHVFCEKPLAITPSELEAIADAIHAPQAPLLMVGFNRRFAPLTLKMADFLKSRREPLAVTCRVNAGYLPPQHWLHDPAQGGGRIIGEACHFIDLLTFLVGEPPEMVSAHALPDVGRYHQDNVQLTFTFPDGSIGSIIYLANGDRAFPKERVEAFSQGKVAVLDDFHSLELSQQGRRSVWRSRLRQDKGHRSEWQAFARALTETGTPPIPYAHLIGVTQASFAAVQSLLQGERVAIKPL